MGPVVLMSSSIDKSDGSKSNKKSEDYVFLDTPPKGGGGTEKRITPSFKLAHVSKKSGRWSSVGPEIVAFVSHYRANF